jgi:hypothetical protein
MTEYMGAVPVSLARRVANWIGAWQQAVSDRAHAEGDAFAAAQGWTVTKSARRCGFGARTYRDPRFDRRAHATAATQNPARTRT